MIDTIGWSMIWIGSAILALCVVMDFASMPVFGTYLPDYSEPPWTPPSPTISDMLRNLEEQDSADNVPLTVHESANLCCGSSLPNHHPTITTEGSITNVQ